MHAQDGAFDSFFFFSEGALRLSIGIASLKIMTYSCTLTLALLHSHSNSPPQAPLELPPYAPQTIAPFSLPALRAGLGYVYALGRSRPTAARAPPRELDTHSAPDRHEGTIVRSIRVGFIDAQQEGEVIDQDSTVNLRRSTIREYAIRERGRGSGVCRSTGGGWRVVGCGSALGCVVPRDPLVWGHAVPALSTGRPQDTIRREGPHTRRTEDAYL